MLPVLQVLQMVCPSYVMGKLKGTGCFLCKMPDFHKNTVMGRKHSFREKHKPKTSSRKIPGVEKLFCYMLRLILSQRLGYYLASCPHLPMARYDTAPYHDDNSWCCRWLYHGMRGTAGYKELHGSARFPNNKSIAMD